MLAVAESARNVACAGAEPIGATNNLNFGNPERPEIMWQFGEAVRGIGDACRALDVPITGGNVSLYNETEGRAIYPTPVLGVVGLLDDASQTRDARRSIGRRRGDRSGRQSRGARRIGVPGAAARHGGRRRRRRSTSTASGRCSGCVVDLVRAGLVRVGARLLRRRPGRGAGGMHVRHRRDRRRGVGGCGAEAGVPASFAAAAALFGESASRIVVSAPEGSVAAVLERAAAAGVPARVVGRTGGADIRIDYAGAPAIRLPVAEAEARWAGRDRAVLRAGGRRGVS